MNVIISRRKFFKWMFFSVAVLFSTERATTLAKQFKDIKKVSKTIDGGKKIRVPLHLEYGPLTTEVPEGYIYFLNTKFLRLKKR